MEKNNVYYLDVTLSQWWYFIKFAQVTLELSSSANDYLDHCVEKDPETGVRWHSF